MTRPRSPWVWAVFVANLPVFVIAGLGVATNVLRVDRPEWTSPSVRAHLGSVAFLLLMLYPFAFPLAVILAVLGTTRRSVGTGEKFGMWLMVLLALGIVANLYISQRVPY